MAIESDYFSEEVDSSFKLFHELMAHKVGEVLLVSSFYDAWILEEDCRLSERIIYEYRGLNLSRPPRLTWVSSAEKALAALGRKRFDLVITMPRLVDMSAYSLGREIKRIKPDLPVILLTHSALTPELNAGQTDKDVIDRVFVWSGNTEILLALIKNVEDRYNVIRDTRIAGVRVILFIEDSPIYTSVLLPILYREVVSQVQNVMVEGLNEEHRLLTMRARPKILHAKSYEEAVDLFRQFEPFVLGVISDVRFPRNGKSDAGAGIAFLSEVKRERFDIPLLLTSSESANREKAADIPASFIDKNSPSLLAEVRAFIVDQLGFGDFVFRMPDGSEIDRAPNYRALERALPGIPDESFRHHWNRNDFSRWLFARAQIILASQIRPTTADDFDHDVVRMRRYLINMIRAGRKWSQKGIVVNFEAARFDSETDMTRIGSGSLGGKARGLAFAATLLRRNVDMQKQFPGVNLIVPKTLVITTEWFDHFIEQNDLKSLSKSDFKDEEIADKFQQARFPEAIAEDLRVYLSQVGYPLAIRSSGLLEDAQFKAYAGLYRTYMIPNDHSHPDIRLKHLISAIKGVYASTYFQGPKAFAQRVGNRTEEEKMAVIVQQLVGENYGNCFYPAISGLAQSHNYYPFGPMKPEEGIVTMALGLGRAVMAGEKTLRFSPKYPQLLPQRSSVDDILQNSQRFFYAMKLGMTDLKLGMTEEATLIKREIDEAVGEIPVQLLASTYFPQEHRIRDSARPDGFPIITFANVLKYDLLPLSRILSEVLAMVHEAMGCAVEIEFSVNLCRQGATECLPEFAVLQVRPMTARTDLMEVSIRREEIKGALCYSAHSLGNTERNDLRDIIYVKPDTFDPARMPDIAREISRLNARVLKEQRKYVLIGPGRWGSADRWLGIPVGWPDISAVGTIVETFSPRLKADPSQGSHFFHNITTLGINYINVIENTDDFLDWDQIGLLPIADQTPHMAHVRLENPFGLKVDGRRSEGVILLADGSPP